VSFQKFIIFLKVSYNILFCWHILCQQCPRSVVFNGGEIAHRGAILCVMGAILWFTRLGANFSFQGSDFCRL